MSMVYVVLLQSVILIDSYVDDCRVKDGHGLPVYLSIFPYPMAKPALSLKARQFPRPSRWSRRPRFDPFISQGQGMEHGCQRWQFLTRAWVQQL